MCLIYRYMDNRSLEDHLHNVKTFSVCVQARAGGLVIMVNAGPTGPLVAGRHQNCGAKNEGNLFLSVMLEQNT